MQRHSTSASALTSAFDAKHPGSNKNSDASSHSDSDSGFGSDSDSDPIATRTLDLKVTPRSRPMFRSTAATLNTICKIARNLLSIVGKTSGITGYPMIRVVEFNDIIEPQGSTTCAVAVIQGLKVGYFESWQSTSKHVQILGAIYSFHRSYREACICYMRAFVNGDVCCLLDDGLTESFTPSILEE
ncbi:hypothetical protein BT96DRAFT_937172 [Gymnopus androsaceus JB14]|uniref:Uncharacterized protein n=1 Tax=Gymnopus androsaceus JB14 TaxID=1447944 RepID=A0A6A4HZA1_9AGAR|nr:hypothetical protein BT96DRAFT_937172 [Gymnopus androsaceus JB14]